MKQRTIFLIAVLLALTFYSNTVSAQELSGERVWGIGVAFIPATSFEAGGFSFPSLTISLRYWSGLAGVESAFTFAIKTPGAIIEHHPGRPTEPEEPKEEDENSEDEVPSVEIEKPSGVFQATFSIKGLYKFAQTPDVDFYLSSGFVSRYHFENFLVPAFRMDIGAEFNDNPNLSTSWEFGYGFRLTEEGDFLDRITTGIGWGRHFYPSPLERHVI